MTARSCAVVYGASPATSTTWASDSLPLSIALAFGYFTNPWAWTYFVFIIMQFIFRQRDDERFCAQKYAADRWAEYQARVKYRIIPGVY